MNHIGACRDEGLWLLNLQEAKIAQSQKLILLSQQTKEDMIDCLQNQAGETDSHLQMNAKDWADVYASLSDLYAFECSLS